MPNDHEIKLDSKQSLGQLLFGNAYQTAERIAYSKAAIIAYALTVLLRYGYFDDLSGNSTDEKKIFIGQTFSVIASVVFWLPWEICLLLSINKKGVMLILKTFA